MSFSGDIKKWSEMTEKRTLIVFKKIAFDVSRAVIIRTPVDTGRARANWLPSINKFSDSVSDDRDKSGSSAISAAQAEASRVDIGDKFTLANNLPYIQKLENGSSDQAPAGMLSISVAEYQQIARKAIREARK